MKEAKKVRQPRSGDAGSPNDDDIYIGKWAYFKEMSFLKDILKPRATQGNFNSNAGSDDDDTQDLNFENSEAVETTEMTEIENVVENPATSENSESVNEGSHEVEDSGNLIARKRVFGLVEDTSDSSSSRVNQKSTRKPKKQQELSHFQLKMIEIEKQKIQAFNAKNDIQDDEDMLFLRSLAPYFKCLTPVQKLRLKSKIQNVIADEISMNTSSTSSARSQSILPSPVNASYTNLSSVRHYYENDPLSLQEYETSTNDSTY